MGHRMDGQAMENGGNVEVIGIPKPPIPFEPRILDARGDTVRPAHPTYMARLDARAKEEITLSKGTLWLLGAFVVIVNLAFLFGGSLLGWAREDQSQREQLNSVQSQMIETRNDVKSLNDKFDKIQEGLQAQALKDAEEKGKEFGYKVGRTDAKGGH